jgi:hypothetical protein
MQSGFGDLVGTSGFFEVLKMPMAFKKGCLFRTPLS